MPSKVEWPTPAFFAGLFIMIGDNELGIAERNRQPISFWQFTKYGPLVTVVTVALSAVYVWLRHFALA